MEHVAAGLVGGGGEVGAALRELGRGPAPRPAVEDVDDDGAVGAGLADARRAEAAAEDRRGAGGRGGDVLAGLGKLRHRPIASRDVVDVDGVGVS